MSDQRATLAADLAIIGGGPAGLSAAIAARRAGVETVVVFEREATAGGIPRNSDHTGYGLRDLHAVMNGPRYADRLVSEARDWRVDVRTASTATDWADGRSFMVTSPGGRLRVDPRAVILATGARERPRAARMVPGDRPSGVMTTGQLQSLVHGRGERAGGLVGLRAVVVGAELVSWSAVLTLREAGCATVMMTTAFDRPESYAAFTIPGRSLLRVPVSRRTHVTRIIGRERVEAVEVMRDASAKRVRVACDTVVFTGDWIPDNELARLAGLTMDSGSRAPLVDTALRTSVDGVFAAGNLLHPVDTADVAALDGRHAATQVVSYLAGALRPAIATRLVAGAGLAWVAPAFLRVGDPPPPRDRLIAWPTASRRVARVAVAQRGEVITTKLLPWPASPGRVLRVPVTILRDIDPEAGEAEVSLA